MNNILSNLILHSSSMLNILTFKTSNMINFFMFSMINVKYLTFDTHDENPLICIKLRLCFPLNHEGT